MPRVLQLVGEGQGTDGAAAWVPMAIFLCFSDVFLLHCIFAARKIREGCLRSSVRV